MVQKRHVRDHEGDDRDSKRKANLKTVEDFAWNEAELEHSLRIVVREAVEKAVLGSSGESSRGRSTGQTGLELVFSGNLKRTTFTGSIIEPDDTSEPIQIVLVDSETQSVVRSGPLSSATVNIVVLRGDFDSDDWSTSIFLSCVVTARKGKRPLLTGERHVALHEGVGLLPRIVVTDNSKCTRSGTFRLGALISGDFSGEVRVKEARSEAFTVRDHRGEPNRKHYPPRQNDDVWRLEKIAKDGKFHEKLAAVEIRTVEEFLRLLARDPNCLRQVLGRVSDRIWNSITNHAQTCKINDDTLLAFHGLDHGVSVYFNAVYTVVGASFNGPFLPIDALTLSQKNLVENLKRQAYRNVDALVPMAGPTIAGPSRPLVDHFNDSTVDPQRDFHGQLQDQYLPQPVTHQLGFASDRNHQPVIPAPQPINHQYQVFPQTNQTNSFSIDNLPAEFQTPITPINNFSPETSWFHFSAPSGWNEAGTSFYIGPNNDTSASELLAMIPGFNPVAMRDTRGRARWSKIRTAVNVCFRFSALGSCRAC